VATLAVLWLGTHSAQAQEVPAAAPPAPATTAAPPERPLFADVHVGIATSFGVDSPTVVLAGNAGAVLWGIGASYKHDGNATGDQDTASGVLNLAYMVYNKFPFAMGPEVTFIPELAPKGFSNNAVQAGWGLWYAPFNIPAVVGTAILVQAVFPDGGSAVVTTVTPAVRIVFGFH
jgi:hypothetical protein